MKKEERSREKGLDVLSISFRSARPHIFGRPPQYLGALDLICASGRPKPFFILSEQGGNNREQPSPFFHYRFLVQVSLRRNQGKVKHQDKRLFVEKKKNVAKCRKKCLKVLSV